MLTGAAGRQQLLTRALPNARCRWDAIWHSELGSAEVVFKAGFTIDSLMARWGCSGGGGAGAAVHAFEGA